MNASSSTRRSRAQSGQAIVIIAVVMVGLMGILGMTIDGGGLYFLHRDTQNAVDAAVVAAIYARCTTTNNTEAEIDAQVIAAAQAAADDNGFTNGSNGVLVEVDPDYTVGTVDDYVEIKITATKPSYFIQLVYKNPLQVTSRAVGYCLPPGGSLLPEAGIVALRPTNDCNSGGGYAFNHGGTSFLHVHNTGVFVNGDDPSCAIRQHGGGEVFVDNDCTTVGGIQGDVNCGSTSHPDEAITDFHPLSDRDHPECTGAGTKNDDAKTLTPGTYGSLALKGTWTLAPGIYCFTELDYKQGTINGDGVVFYMEPGNDGIHSNGQGNANLISPNATNCAAGNTCDWMGLLLWSNVTDENGGTDDNNGEIHINGGGGGIWRGMIYAPGSNCTMEGGANLHIYSMLVCWGVRGEGNSEVHVWYERPEFLYTPPEVMIAD